MEEKDLQKGLGALVRSLPARVVRRVDGWVNVLTSMGTVADKTANTLPYFGFGLPDDVLEDMFHGDAIVRKICTKPAAEALRLGIRIQMPDEAGGVDIATAFQDAFDDLDVVGKFVEALTWENVFGGSVIYLGLDDGQLNADSQAQPVRWERLQRVLWLKVLDRRRIRPSYEAEDRDNDPRSPTFGEPMWFWLHVRSMGAEVRVHRSRLIVFPGQLTTEFVRWQRDGWGLSIIDSIYEALQRNATAWQSAGNALANAQYVVYKLKGLASMFSADGGEAKAKSRARAMELAKSMINAVLIDSEDEYDRENPNFGNMPDMLDQFMLDVCAHADFPATVLWGRSPAGMNATGESDLQLWDNKIQSLREHHIRARAQQLVLALMYSKQGPTRGQIYEGWRVYFPPLRELTDLEKADVRLKNSQADASDINAGILLPQEAAMSHYRPEGYSQEVQIDLDLRQKLLKLETERTVKMLQEPTPSEMQDRKAEADAEAKAPEAAE